MRGTAHVGFLVCPAETLVDDFVQRPRELDPDLVRAVSKHLARCAPCREEADRHRRGLEAAGVRRPWPWACLAIAAMACGAAVFLYHELVGPAASSAGTGGSSGLRFDPRIAALARFDPPSDDAVAAAAGSRSGAILYGGAAPLQPLSLEDTRELAAARARLEAGAHLDAARLLEDLCARHTGRGGLRLLLAYAYARSGEFEKARAQYAFADREGFGTEACWGHANASLRLGDIAAARRELSEHILARHPDDEAARDLLARLNASGPRTR